MRLVRVRGIMEWIQCVIDVNINQGYIVCIYTIYTLIQSIIAYIAP